MAVVIELSKMSKNAKKPEIEKEIVSNRAQGRFLMMHSEMLAED